MSIRRSEKCLVCAVNVIDFSIFQMNMSTMERLNLVAAFCGSTIRKLLVVVVCPGSMKVNMCVISGKYIVLGSKNTRIIMLSNFVYTGFMNVFQVELECPCNTYDRIINKKESTIANCSMQSRGTFLKPDKIFIVI